MNLTLLVGQSSARVVVKAPRTPKVPLVLNEFGNAVDLILTLSNPNSMKTIIQFNKDDNRLEISDDGMDNDNFVTVRIIDQETFVETEVPVDELLATAQAFVEKRTNRLEREKLQS